MKLVVNRDLIAIFCTMLLTSPLSHAQSEWEIDMDKEGIQVYTRLEEGSDFKAFKAVMIVTASTDEILKVLKNADDYINWYGYTKVSKVLKQAKEVQYNYVETIFPWPYTNRDMVYRMSIGQPDIDGAIKISLRGIPDYVEEKRGIVRMTKAAGFILLQPRDRQTEVIYQFHSEPGDNIPVWLANSSIAELPFKTLSGLRKMLGEKE